MHYYFKLQSTSSNFNIGLGKQAAALGWAGLPIAGGIAGHMYGSSRHKKSLANKQAEIDATLDPFRKGQLQQELDQMNKGGFWKGAGMIGAGALGGATIKGLTRKPMANWILKDAFKGPTKPKPNTNDLNIPDVDFDLDL